MERGIGIKTSKGLTMPTKKQKPYRVVKHNSKQKDEVIVEISNLKDANAFIELIHKSDRYNYWIENLCIDGTWCGMA